ncbi:MAG: DUF6064 family protein [Methyloligellaceae bacterium]
MLPFTAEAFFALFEDYNAAIWPAQVVAYGLGALALWLSFRPRPGSNRTIAGVLAACWLWTGLVYHVATFDVINVAAPVFGGLFALQALLLVWTGVVRGRLVFHFQPDIFGWVGLGLAVFAMALYPLIAWLADHGWPEAAMFGVAPSPTTLFTFGMLLAVEGRSPLYLLVIPVLWSLIWGGAAWFLDISEDLALPLAAIVGTGLMVWKNRRAARASG